MALNERDEALVPLIDDQNRYDSRSAQTSHLSVSQNNLNPSQLSYNSCLTAIFLTVNATLGAGLLNIPHAFNESGGILYASIVQTIFVVLIIGSLLILTYCTDISNAISYQEVVSNFCGLKCQHLCSITIILYSYGACITFIIIIGDQFDRTFLSLYGSDFSQYWYMNRSYTMLATSFLLILPLSFSKKIGFLKIASLIGFCATFYIIFLAIFQYTRLNTENVVVRTEPQTWTKIFDITPVLCFSYQCQLSWVPTYAGMKHRIGSIKISITIIVSILICYISYTITAIFGLLTFGSNDIESDLMLNYDVNDWYVFAGVIILIAKTITVYPLLLFCGRVAVEDFMQLISQSFPTIFRFCNNSSRFELLRRIIIVMIWVFSTVLMAIYIPNITIAIEYLGSLATLFVFTFPGLCLLIAILSKDMNLYLLKDRIYIFIASIYIVLGVFIFGLTLTQTIRKN